MPRVDRRALPAGPGGGSRPGSAARLVGALVPLLLAASSLTACSASLPGGNGETAARTPVAATSAPASDPAGQPAFAAFYQQKISWAGCGEGFECGSVTVPVDWATPSGATLKLALIRRRAGGSKIGSLLVNPGGPGVSGVNWVRTAASAYGAGLRAGFDLVGWDPRGIGQSDPIRCLSNTEMDTYVSIDSTPDTPAEQTDLVAENKRFATGCQAHTDAVLAHVDTLSTVKDMDVIRAVLGDATLSYFGASYGTFLGAWYAQTFPWRVGRMVLDGAVDPSLDGKRYLEGQAMGFDRGLQAYLAECLTQQTCPLRGTAEQARAQLAELIARSDAQPLPTSTGRRLTQSLLVTGIVQGMYSQSLWPRLNQALGQAMQGNGSALLVLADAYNERGPNGQYEQTMQATGPIYCLDHPERRSLAQIASDAAELGRRYPPLGDSIGWSAVGCATWPFPAVLAPQRLTAPGAAPILVIGTTGDPATPYEWAKALAAQLSSGRLLTRQGFGHTAYFEGSTCVDTAVDSYLLTGRLPAEGRTCQ